VEVVRDVAPREVSIMYYLIGREPVSVTAAGASHGDSPTENIAYVTVRFEGSLIGHVHVNWLAPAKVRRTIVGGSKKMMIYDDMEPSEKLKVYDKGFSIEADPTVEPEYQLMVSYRSGDMHVPQLNTREALAVEADNVVQAILGKGSLDVDGRAGARVVRILEAAQRSIDQGGVVVPVNGAAVPKTS
jgi:predicted dehydrogenase